MTALTTVEFVVWGYVLTDQSSRGIVVYAYGHSGGSASSGGFNIVVGIVPQSDTTNVGVPASMMLKREVAAFLLARAVKTCNT